MLFSRFSSIWNLTRGVRLRYAAAIAALVVASCFLYLAPLIPQIVIDGVLTEPGEDPSNYVQRAVELLGGRAFLGDNLWLPAVLIIAVTAIAGVFTYLRGRWAAMGCEQILRRVRDRVYNHLQHLPARYFDSAETGDLIQRCTSDVETLRLFLSQQIVEIGRAMIMLLAPIPLMLMIDVRMTIASLVLIPIVVGYSVVFFVKVKSAFREADEAEGRLTATLQENLTGIRVVRAFARQDFEKNKFAGRNTTHRSLNYRLYQLLAWYWSVSDLLCFLQKAIVLVAGGWWMAAGELGVGAFFFFLSAVTMFIWPVRMMGRILTDLGKAVVALGRLEEILDEPLESAPVTSVDADQLRGEIIFDDVTFSHSEESPVLDAVSFDLQAGKTLAILGPSGCGKSTIVNLLLRLYDYDAGSIQIDGIELETLDRKAIRRQIAVVMQEPFLYSKTLRENITIGRPGAKEDEMIRATETASVHDAIRRFEHGYNAMVGERGVTLSGGQRQRVALARALMQDPAILILDDALSAVDTETESMILDALAQRRGRHSTILIAHRLSTVMHADSIIVLEHGRITQQGAHTQLLETPGLYQRLWTIQNATGEEQLEPAGRR